MDTGEVNEFAMTLLFDPHKNYNIWGFRELMDKMIEMQKEMPEDRSVLDRMATWLWCTWGSWWLQMNLQSTTGM